MANPLTKDEIERKVNENPNLTDTEKEAAKGRLLEMHAVVTKATIDSQDRRELMKKSYQLICVSSITLNQVPNAIDMYLKLEDDGTRLRDIINNAYKQFNFLTPIDTMLNFINALPKTHLKVAAVYALFSAMRQREHLDNVKMLRVQEYINETIVPLLTETEVKENNLYKKLPEKVAKYVNDALTTCATKVQEEKYGEIIFYARECPENFEKHVSEIVKRSYKKEHFENILNFVLALPTDGQKTVGLNEILALMKEKNNVAKPELEILEEKIKAIENPSFDSILDQIKGLSI